MGLVEGHVVTKSKHQRDLHDKTFIKLDSTACRTSADNVGRDQLTLQSNSYDNKKDVSCQASIEGSDFNGEEVEIRCKGDEMNQEPNVEKELDKHIHRLSKDMNVVKTDSAVSNNFTGNVILGKKSSDGD